MTPLRPCPHRETIPGPDATPADLAGWAATLAAATCPQCAAPPPVEAAAPADPLPPDVAAALRWEGREGAARAQVALDAMGVGAGLLGAVAARLSEQPGTCVGWQRWWAEWRGGALCGAAATIPEILSAHMATGVHYHIAGLLAHLDAHGRTTIEMSLIGALREIGARPVREESGPWYIA